jgi:hypothetical protein
VDKNIIEQIVVPYNPPSANVVQRNQYNLFAPIGGINRVGMVGYSADDFVIIGDNILALRVKPEEITENIEKYVDAKFETKLDKKEPLNTLPHMYTVGKIDGDDIYYEDGTNPVLRPGRTTPTPYTVVVRDKNGTFTVPSTPTTNAQPASKLYVDQSFTPVKQNIADIVRKVSNLEYASTGNIYNNVTLSGTARSFQVDKACPYGVFTKLGCVKKLKCILPFNLSKSSNITSVGVNGFKPTVGKTAYIRCDVPKGKTVKVNAEGVNGTVVKRFSLSSLVGGSGFDESAKYFNSNVFVTAAQDNKYIYVEKDGDESEYTNFQVVFSDNYVSSDTDTITVVSEIEIPSYIRALSGYDREGAYLDLIEKKLYTGYYAPQDIDTPELKDIINFPLLPSMIVQFIGEDENKKETPIDALYEIVYKNKI